MCPKLFKFVLKLQAYLKFTKIDDEKCFIGEKFWQNNI